MLSTSAGSLQDLHNSYSYSFIWKIYQTHLKPQTWCNLFSRWLLRADLRNNQPQVVGSSWKYLFSADGNNQPDFLQIVKIVFFPITDTFQHFCFTFVFLSNDFFLSPNGMNQNQERKYSRIHFHRLMYSKIKIAVQEILSFVIYRP